MDSLTFTPGRAFLSSNSTAVPWTAVFEDEGPAGYFYACDRSRETQEESILDAMLIYNTSALQDPARERIAGRPAELPYDQLFAAAAEPVLIVEAGLRGMSTFCPQTSRPVSMSSIAKLTPAAGR